MTKDEFLRLVESEMEIGHGSLQEDRLLTQIEGWDSMAVVIFVALADQKLGVTLSGDDVVRARTVADLLSLTGTRLRV